MIRLLEIVGCWEVMPVLILTPIQEYGILSTSDRKRNYINNFDKWRCTG
jgi:hypothetical protein